MFGTRRSSLQCLAFALTLHIAVIAGEFFKPFDVTYDHRALIIDGKRRILNSAGIHYRRATPEDEIQRFVKKIVDLMREEMLFSWQGGPIIMLQFVGGTNFGRTAGGPNYITGHDYDAPIDEYGLLRQPRWGHLKDLHDATKLCEPALVAVDLPQCMKLGPKQEAHLYGTNVHSEGQTLTLSGNKSTCSAFLANIDEHNAAAVTFFGQAVNQRYDML
ncbi:Beta-galactosidase 15 [Camellia lanceoleosa]|nr:Beta-galactosidase 15 [Camellia lanceoleosa]